MALSRTLPTVDGVTRIFNLGFSYQDKSEIEVYVNGVLSTNWYWHSLYSIGFEETPTLNDVLEIRRTTNVASRKVVFTTSNMLQAPVMNTNALQLYYKIQELHDDMVDVFDEQLPDLNTRIDDVEDAVDALETSLSDIINTLDSDVDDRIAAVTHGDLASGIGINTHDQIDSHIGNSSIHIPIDDEAESLTKTWSSQKIITMFTEELLEQVDYTIEELNAEIQRQVILFG